MKKGFYLGSVLDFAGIMFGVGLSVQPVFAHRFLCNSLDSEGGVYQDNCGVCDDETAARWKESQVQVHVDLEVRPNGLGREEWLSIVQKGLHAWNEVPGAQLQLVYAGESNSRSFGESSHTHDIFWIDNAEEWRRKVGGGERGALGVTIAPYNCPSKKGGMREIFDADLVMNAVTAFAWSEMCAPGEKCISIAGTLIHELGHFIGLGHPCVNCSWSLMSAQAAFNTPGPLPDDMNGLRSLYPTRSNGFVGATCATDKDCQAPSFCEEQDGQRYCSQRCQPSAQQCPHEMVCDADFGREGVCHFVMGRLAGAAQKGQTCFDVPCEEGLLCVGDHEDRAFCRQECINSFSCETQESCVPLEYGGGVCVRLSQVGETCNKSSPCAQELVCVANAGSDAKCRKPCDIHQKNTCGLSESCQLLRNGRYACLETSMSILQPGNDVPTVEQKNQEGGSWFSGCNHLEGHINRGPIDFLVHLLVACFFVWLAQNRLRRAQ